MTTAQMNDLAHRARQGNDENTDAQTHKQRYMVESLLAQNDLSLDEEDYIHLDKWQTSKLITDLRSGAFAARVAEVQNEKA